jgi:hypothetical protein
MGGAVKGSIANCKHTKVMIVLKTWFSAPDQRILAMPMKSIDKFETPNSKFKTTSNGLTISNNIKFQIK